MPVFPGGDITKWINKHVKYPMIAQENGVQGKVIVQFVVGKDGTVGDIKVVRGVDSSLGPGSRPRHQIHAQMESREAER